MESYKGCCGYRPQGVRLILVTDQLCQSTIWLPYWANAESVQIQQFLTFTSVQVYSIFSEMKSFCSMSYLALQHRYVTWIILDFAVCFCLSLLSVSMFVCHSCLFICLSVTLVCISVSLSLVVCLSLFLFEEET